MDHYAVFGHPIGHSLSPRIHGEFARQTGQVIQYEARDVPAAQFTGAVRAFLTAGGCGLNCTVPLKELAFRLADRVSARARAAGAVNTLRCEADGTLLGENTDGAGLVRDLTANLERDLAGRRILILGAGGATRGILLPLLALRPELVFIANRTEEKAVRLAAEFSAAGVIQGGGFIAPCGEPFDLVLNATSASLTGESIPLSSTLLSPDALAYDLAYGAKPTPFVRWAREHGVRLAVDGLGMLVEQAAEAFELWRGVRPDTAPVLSLLRRERGG